MALVKFPVQDALDLIDGRLAAELNFQRIDGPERSKAQFFEVGPKGRQFAVIVGDADAQGKYPALQTRILFEYAPPTLPDVEAVPELDYYNSSPVKRTFSRLAPPSQRSTLIGSTAALRTLLTWYTESQEAGVAGPGKSSGHSHIFDIAGNEMEATNVILYGPPGTGKTFSTFSRAVLTCDGKLPDEGGQQAIMERYEVLRKEERISFVTFHQSYGYEEFVEGLRPELVDGGSVNFHVQPGAFRLACDAARRTQSVKPGLSGVPLKERTIFKMSLGDTTNSEGATVFQYCLEHQCILLGWGGKGDFSECSTQASIKALYEQEYPDVDDSESASRFVHYFKHELKVGSLVIVSSGNTGFRAIAEVTGEYQYVDSAPFHQMRAVKWLAVYEVMKPASEIFHKNFSQQTLYRLSNDGIEYSKLAELVAESVDEPSVKPHVLIIDEINRANISKVFGELITLLEPDKRAEGRFPITVRLPYSREDFSVPSNLHVLGTMNTADRSIALLDTALRRRFDFEELMPQPSVLAGKDVDGINIQKLLIALNERIEALYDRDHMIGHAFLIGIQTIDDLEAVFRRKVLPLLQEYFYENWSSVRRVLNDVGAGDFIEQRKLKPLPVDGDDSYDDESRVLYAVNPSIFPVSAYKRIYGET